jgi:hypothetical protein
VVASLNRKDPAGIREFTFFNIFDPGSINADWDIMFLLASYSAGVTSDAFAIVDDEPEFCHAVRIIDLNGKETKNILNV